MTGSGQETGRRRTGRTQQPARQRRPAHLAWSARCALISLFASFAGCSSLTSARVEAVSVERVPREIIDVLRKDEFQEISLARLRQDPPDQYLLAAGDLLGIYIEDLLGDIANPDDEGDKTPAFALSGDPDLPPIVGVPIPVSEAGTIDLPVLGPVNVGGQSVVEVTRRLRDMYRRRNIILPGEEARILVTVIKRRTVRYLSFETNPVVCRVSRSAVQVRCFICPATKTTCCTHSTAAAGSPGSTRRTRSSFIAVCSTNRLKRTK